MCHVRGAKAALIAACVSVAGASALATTGTWTAVPADADWTNAANWDGGIIPGDNLGASSTSTDYANFNASSGLTVEPDLNRAVGRLIFGATAGAYVVGATTSSNQISTAYLYVNGTTPITVNAPVRYRGDSRIGPVAGATVNVSGTQTITAGLTLLFDNNGTANMDGQLISSATTGNYPGIRFLGGTAAKTMNLNTTNLRLNATMDAGGLGTLNLNAAGALPANLYLGTGKVYVNAQDAINGLVNANPSAGNLNIGNAYHATARAFMEIKASNSYTGVTTIGNPTLSQVGAIDPTLLVNNPTGSGTGNSDINVLTGILGGNGFIVNSDTMTPPAMKGVTLRKRVDTTAGAGRDLWQALAWRFGRGDWNLDDGPR